MTSSCKAVFIGQTPIDIIARVDHHFIEQHDLIKSSTKIIDTNESHAILSKLENPQRIPGGGAANVACMFSHLQGQAFFNGKIANDNEGHLFLDSLKDRGVDYVNDLFDKTAGSDLIYTFITPDYERSFAACYRISSSLDIKDYNLSCLDDVDAVFFEGFLFNNKGGHEMILNFIDHIKKMDNSPLIVFCPCDPIIVSNNKTKLNHIFKDVDIIIMNEHEAKAYAPDMNIQDIVKNLQAKHCFGAITLGENGAYAFSKDEIVHAKAHLLKSDEIVNMNGAGDAFAGGFLNALLAKKSLSDALDIAQNCAIQIIKRVGAR